MMSESRALISENRGLYSYLRRDADCVSIPWNFSLSDFLSQRVSVYCRMRRVYATSKPPPCDGDGKAAASVIKRRCFYADIDLSWVTPS